MILRETTILKTVITMACHTPNIGANTLQRRSPQIARQPAPQRPTTPEPRPELTISRPDLTVTASSLESGMQTEQSNHFPSITLKSASKEGLQLGQQALGHIASRPAGHGLLTKLESMSKKGRVTIKVGPKGTQIKNLAKPIKRDSPFKKPLSFFIGNRYDAEVHWNPSTSMLLNESGRPIGFEDNGDRAYVSLAHELVHAYRIVKTTYTGWGEVSGADPRTKKGQEELRAVGLGKYETKKFSENKIREEHGLPRRNFYPRRPEDKPFDGTARVYGTPEEET